MVKWNVVQDSGKITFLSCLHGIQYLKGWALWRDAVRLHDELSPIQTSIRSSEPWLNQTSFSWLQPSFSRSRQNILA